MKTKGFSFIVFAAVLLWGWNILFSQEWSREIQVSETGTTTPDIDIDPITGHLHIVTMLSGPGVLYTEMDKDGNKLQQYPISVASRDDAKSGMRWGASIAVDPQGRPHLCYRQFFGGEKYTSYYTYWNGSNWTSPVELSSQIYRGWVVRIDVDNYGKAHIARGSTANDPNDPEGNLLAGPVKYFRLISGSFDGMLDDITRYCGDRRLEIDASYQNQIHLILGCSDYPDHGGPVWYWRSLDGGSTWFKNDIHSPEARHQNSSPDLFVDASGHVHIVYGSETDLQRGGKHSVRYVRFENNEPKFDIPITDAGEITRTDPMVPNIGIGSVAANQDGQIVMVAYSEDFGARLFIRESYDGGQTWSNRILIAPESVGSEGRNRHLIRAYNNNFYVIYPTPEGVKLRYKQIHINQPPVADAGGPYTANEGSPINFTASGSSDADGNIIQYEWDFQNDGKWDATTTAPNYSFTYKDNFRGQAIVRITDNELATDTDVAEVTINNVAPTASAGGPYSGNINEVIRFQGTATDPGNDTFIYKWDLDNNGTFETTGQVAEKSYLIGGSYKVVLKVIDDDGGEGIDTADVSIQNEPPVIGNIANQTINEGENFKPINLYDAVTDPDNADNEISWTFLDFINLQISVQNKSWAYVTVIDSEWNGTETVKFIATDPGKKADTATVSFTINPVNDPPQVSPISVPEIEEGTEAFDYIFLDEYVYDPDNQDYEVSWSATGQKNLKVQIDQSQRVTIVSPPDNNWYGSEKITFIATDGLLEDRTTATFTVIGVNDPPVITGIPNQTIRHMQAFLAVLLDTCVTDVDNAVSEIRWSYFGNKNLAIQISNHLLTITRPNPDWMGSDEVTFIASDGQLSDSSKVKFTVIYKNDPPVLSDIPNQTINENGRFEKINLDQIAHDPDHADELLKWSYAGNIHLRIEELAQRMIQIAVIDSEWAGSETITFMVTDPDGLQDSASATFKVIPINDPPVLKQIPDFVFNEDTTYTITDGELKLLASDPDNPISELTFSIGNNTHTHSRFEPETGNMVISADPNWNGVEKVLFIVYDKEYANDSQPINITVNPRPDPPLSFKLSSPAYGTIFSIKPPSINFVWQKAIDPDGDQSITYTWNLSREANFAHIMDQYNALTDTILTFKLPDKFNTGVYYWQVIAMDEVGNSTPCKNNGAFNLESNIGVEAEKDGTIPNQFALLPNYPNPFNPETKITYLIPIKCQVRLTIYNNLGQLIRTLVDQNQNAGTYSIFWDGRNESNEPVSSGIYVYKIEADNFMMARKMLLLQ